MIDPHELLFTITDLKQYIYCPRIFYYHTCLPNIRPTTYKMQKGIDAHEQEQKRALRRCFQMYDEPSGQRHFDVSVQSAALQLSGQVDEIIETNTGVLIPVDYKLARKAGYHFKVQLAAYARLLEETTTQRVPHGFLYLLLSKQTLKVSITPKLRDEVKLSLDDMHRISQTEWMPSPTEWRQRCADCEFRRFCNDV